MNNKRLYKEQRITLNQNWSETTNYVSSNDHDEDNSDHSDHKECEVPNTISSGTSSKTQLDEDDWSEHEAEIPCGVTDTMLTATNFLEENEPHCVFNVAPAEGNRPLSVFRDKHSEELAYAGIFLGEKRPDNDERLTPVYYSDICKSEVRRSDRRAATCVENLFFKAKKLQMKSLLGKSQVALRKCKGNHKSSKAGPLKHQGALEKLIHQDEGFNILKTLRGSPPYFQKAERDIFAMIRQLGPASLFCSFSSAETQWTHLSKIQLYLVNLLTRKNTVMIS